MSSQQHHAVQTSPKLEENALNYAGYGFPARSGRKDLRRGGEGPIDRATFTVNATVSMLGPISIPLPMATLRCTAHAPSKGGHILCRLDVFPRRRSAIPKTEMGESCSLCLEWQTAVEHRRRVTEAELVVTKADVEYMLRNSISIWRVRSLRRHRHALPGAGLLWIGGRRDTKSWPAM